MKIQCSQKHYFEMSYDSKERFVSYWNQTNELIKLRCKTYLEIGIGNGLVSDYLKKRKYCITTMDIDPTLNPDVIGSIEKIPFVNESFDAVACFEVLEHFPYEQTSTILREIYRVTKKFVVLSLPDANRTFRILFHLPKIGELKKLVELPRLRKLKNEFNGEHYWEIGKKGFKMQRIIKDIKQIGFSIEKTYRVFDFPQHRFFILTK